MKQLGRSMVEMLCVLAIVGILSIGGLVLYRKSLASMKANDIIENVQFSIRAKSEDAFIEKENDTSGVDCVSQNGYMESCSCQHKDGTIICSVSVKEENVAEEITNKLGIDPVITDEKISLDFCVRLNTKVKMDYNNNDGTKRTFMWENSVCE